jgi:tungstate transport system substrate-binding protein
LLGPAKDPAKIKGEKSIGKALAAIAVKQSPFISRGDDSGTHAKELAMWKESGVPLVKKGFTVKRQNQDVNLTFEVPDGAWYISIGQGMGKTLMMAEEKQAYTISDRGTYIQQKFGKKPPLELEILVEGDKGLLNPYGIIPVNPAKHPSVNVKAATKFAEWLVSPKGQKTIAGYQLEGKQLFFPDAIPGAK